MKGTGMTSKSTSKTKEMQAVSEIDSVRPEIGKFGRDQGAQKI
jgi:hypothetical protein